MAKSQDYQGVYRVGGISAIISGILGVLLVGLFFLVGRIPTEGGALLEAIDSNSLIFRAAFGFMLVFQLAILPVIPSLYLSVKGVARTHAMFGGFIAGTGAILGIAFASIFYSTLSLSNTFATSFGAEKPALAAAAQFAISFSNILFLVSYALLAIGLFIIFGLAILKGIFSKWMGWLGVVTGIVILLSIIPPLNALFFVATALMAAWFLAIGAKLYRA